MSQTYLSATARLQHARGLAAEDAKSRVTLDATEKALAEFSIAVALRSRGDAFRNALHQASENGISHQNLSDVVLQLAAYLGFTGVEHAAQALDEYAATLPAHNGEGVDIPQSDHASRYAYGIARYGELNPVALDNIRAAFDDVASQLIDATFSSFGDTFGASALDVKHKQIVTVAALAAVANAAPQLQFHIGAAMHVGVSQRQIVDIILLVQAHAGMPAAYNALIAAKSAFDAGTDASPGYR